MGLQLVLRMVADIGIVGFPNAGEGREEGRGGRSDGGGLQLVPRVATDIFFSPSPLRQELPTGRHDAGLP